MFWTFTPLAGANWWGMKLRIDVCDGFRIWRDADALNIKSRKAAALLGYLALKPGLHETRERIAGLFWSEKSEEHARGSLRQCLRQIWMSLGEVGEHLFRADVEDIGFSASVVETDLSSAYDGLKAGSVSSALIAGRVLPERLLYGYEDLDPSFASWLRVTREKWHALFVEELERLLAAPANAKSGAQAAEALLALDPTHEIAVRAFMRYRAAVGNVPAALKSFEFFRRTLRSEYDLEPEDETEQLAGALRAGSVRRNDVANSNTPVAGQSIELRPTIWLDRFDATGVAEDSLHIAAGLRQMLLASLSRFRHWTVIDSGYPRDGDFVSDETAAPSYVLKIEAVDANERLGLSAKLAESRVGRIVWSEFLFVGRGEWADAGEHIVRNLAASLDIYLSADRMQRSQRSDHGSIAAFDRWMKGVFLLEKFEPEADNEAERHLRDVIVLSPEFGPAHASLAGIYNSRHIVFPGVRRNREREELALRLAQRAVELEPLDARCHVTLGWSLALSKRFHQAELAFDLADELNPFDPALLLSAAHGSVICGAAETAIQRSRRAMRAHPHPPRYFFAIDSGIHFHMGDYRACIAAAEKGGDFLIPLLAWKAAAHGFLGQRTAAVETAQTFLGKARAAWNGEQPPLDSAITAVGRRHLSLRIGDDAGKIAGRPDPCRSPRDGLGGSDYRQNPSV